MNQESGFWFSVVYFLVAALALSVGFGFLLRYQPLIYLVIATGALFSGYPIIGLFKANSKRPYYALLLIGVLGGGALGVYWDELAAFVAVA